MLILGDIVKMIHCLVDLQLDGSFSYQDKESDEVDEQIADSEVSLTKLICVFN